MTCADVRASISAYYDGELPPAEREPIATHLAACPACRAVLHELVELGAVLRAGSAAEVSEEMWGRIAAAAQQTSTARRLRARIWLLRVAAAAAGLALYLYGYGLIAPESQTPAGWPAAPDAPVEFALRETGAAFAGNGLFDEPARLFTRRPEALLFTELTKDVGP